MTLENGPFTGKRRHVQVEVSKELDVPRQAVSRRETGDSKVSTKNFQALCKLYNVKWDDLLNDSDEGLPIEKLSP